MSDLLEMTNVLLYIYPKEHSPVNLAYELLLKLVRCPFSLLNLHLLSCRVSSACGVIAPEVNVLLRGENAASWLVL